MLWRGRNLSWCKVCPEPRFLVLVTDPRFFIKQLHFGFGWNKSNLMRKILLLLSVFALFSCSSDESKSDSPNSDSTNYIAYDGEKYYLTEATIERRDNSVSSSFLINFMNKPMTHDLAIYIELNCKTCPIEDLESASYSSKVREISLLKYKNGSAIKILSAENLSATNINSVIVTKNSDGTHKFQFNFHTKTGIAIGEYVGKLNKLNF
jgi:hypothetical protein